MSGMFGSGFLEAMCQFPIGKITRGSDLDCRFCEGAWIYGEQTLDTTWAYSRTGMYHFGLVKESVD